MREPTVGGRAGAIGQHKRLDSLGDALPFLWEKLGKGKKEGIRNCYVLSWTPCKFCYRNFFIWSLKGPNDTW